VDALLEAYAEQGRRLTALEAHTVDLWRAAWVLVVHLDVGSLTPGARDALGALVDLLPPPSEEAP
jgi:hypothetical protein